LVVDVVVVIELVVVFPSARLKFELLVVLVFVDDEVLVVAVVKGHCGQPLQYQFLQELSQPPCMLPHRIGKHCAVLTVDVVAVVKFVVFVVSVVVIKGHSGHDAQNH
jgi:hypothetical protein